MYKEHKNTKKKKKTNESGKNHCGAQNISYREIHILQNQQSEMEPNIVIFHINKCRKNMNSYKEKTL